VIITTGGVIGSGGYLIEHVQACAVGELVIERHAIIGMDLEGSTRFHAGLSHVHYRLEVALEEHCDHAGGV
jgi:hypothetical protein